jgi:hypothetical protein
MKQVEIQIYLQQKKVRVVLLGSGQPVYQELPIYTELISGNDEDDYKYVAAHIIQALKQNGLVSDEDQIVLVNVPEAGGQS